MGKKLTAYEATAPNGHVYQFNASTNPVAVRFLDITDWPRNGRPHNCGDRTYLFSTHRSLRGAQTSFQSPAWRPLLRPDSIVTDIRESSISAAAPEGETMTVQPEGETMTTEAPAIVEPTITERLVAALTVTWRAIQRQHPEVPDVVLTLGSGTLGRRGGEKTWGHFAHGRWQLAAAPADGEQREGLHELFMAGERLRGGPRDVLATLLHEAAHGLATAREITDTSRQGRYHNKRFKTLAEELGLVVTEEGKFGWSGTALSPQAEQRYAAELEQLAAAITAYRLDEAPGRSGKSKSTNLLVAQCACPRKIRVARSTLAEAPIVCGACDVEFTTADDDREPDDE